MASEQMVIKQNRLNLSSIIIWSYWGWWHCHFFFLFCTLVI